jgi:NADH dehydrogenase
MDKYLIVTGANGYLGKYVCIEAIKQGYKVLAFCFDHYASVKLEHNDITYIYCDISKPFDTNNEIIDKIKSHNIVGIINAAALLGSSDIEKNRAVNATGVKHLIDFAKKLNITRFVQVSSVVILKAIKGPYGITKLEGQQIIEQSDLDYTVFIPAMILGPESLGINRILQNVFRFPLLVPMVGGGKQTQHPIFVKDFAKYLVKSVEQNVCTRKVYQIASESVIPFRDVIKLILSITNKKKMLVPIPVFIVKMLGKFFQATQKVPIFTAEHVKGVLQDSHLDTSMLKNDLDFTPTPLNEALTYTLTEINGRWNDYMKPREERTIKL